MLDSEPENEERVVEIDLPPFPGKLHPLLKRHGSISLHIFEADPAPSVSFIFWVTASLCDPYTQPEEGRVVLSVDTLSDVLIALAYKNHVTKMARKPVFDDAIKGPKGEEKNDNGDESPCVSSVKFTLSVHIFTVLHALQKGLSADDELGLRYVDNSEANWQQNMRYWTPKSNLCGDPILRICYLMLCVLVAALYKLFLPEDGTSYNLAKNPYLQYLVKLWKCHSNIIILGLEVDRRVEEAAGAGEYVATPPVLNCVLRGLSAVRTVLGWVLNQNPLLLYLSEGETMPTIEHDIREISLLDFSHPLIRLPTSGGALLIDMRFVVMALFVLKTGIDYTPGKDRVFPRAPRAMADSNEENRRLDQSEPLVELSDLLLDLEYDDKFDDDIRYIFGYEFSLDDEEDEKKSSSAKVRAVEVQPEFDFDEHGRDWRDMARGPNVEALEWFEEYLSRPRTFKHKTGPLVTVPEVFSSQKLPVELDIIISAPLNSEHPLRTGEAKELLRTVARAIWEEERGENTTHTSPDEVYRYFLSPASESLIASAKASGHHISEPIYAITQFEVLMLTHDEFARALMDEMLMCRGLRRPLIWLLTHSLNLSQSLVDYVFELVAGLRGTPERQKTYKFSRKGACLQLSDVEKLMLLHELLTGASVFISSTEGVDVGDGMEVVLSETTAKNLIRVLCLMLNQLLRLGLISLDKKKQGTPDDIHDYTNDIETLLINWIGKVPEARELFFRVKSQYSPELEKQATEEVSQTAIKELRAQNRADMARLAAVCANKSSDEIALLVTQQKDMGNILDAYMVRLEKHLKTLTAFQLDEVAYLEPADVLSDMGAVNDDFRFFLDHFNVLSRIEEVAERLFAVFEQYIVAGLLNLKKMEVPDSVPFESEFSEEFLNGEGHFKADQDENKAAKNEKKEKLKKKKKKSRR